MPRDPVLIAYAAQRSPRGKTVWTRIGEAHQHEAGAGLTLLLNAILVDGRVILLERGDDDEARLEREAKRGAKRPAGPCNRRQR
jgi:hypothetical protein